MRKRSTNKHLPPNVHLKSGTYYYVYYAEAKRKWHKIGKSLSEAMDNWSKLVEPSQNIVMMAQLFDRYMIEIAPKKSAASYRNNKMEVGNLYKAFGHMSPEAITPVHIYKYLDIRGKSTPVKANREKALLSHVFSMAIRWGLVRDNPCKNVKNLTENRRDRYISDEDFESLKKIAPDHLRILMDFAYMTGLRQGDILEMPLSSLGNEGIFVLINKTSRNTKQKILIEWSDELKKNVLEAQLRASQLNSNYLFPNLSGKKYTSSGFQSNWQKLMKKGIEEKIITERFHFHDIRRKTATDVENLSGRETARQLLGHTDQKTTAIYISGVQKVKPVK